jgi:hypothetical protein
MSDSSNVEGQQELKENVRLTRLNVDDSPLKDALPSVDELIGSVEFGATNRFESPTSHGYPNAEMAPDERLEFVSHLTVRSQAVYRELGVEEGERDGWRGRLKRILESIADSGVDVGEDEG